MAHRVPCYPDADVIKPSFVPVAEDYTSLNGLSTLNVKEISESFPRRAAIGNGLFSSNEI
jgi:hypothetical protein